MHGRTVVMVALSLAGCRQPSTAGQLPASMGEVYAQLDAKCGEDRQTLARLIEVGAARVESMQGMEMSPYLLAVVLNHRIPQGRQLEHCAPVIESLAQEIMRS